MTARRGSKALFFDARWRRRCLEGRGLSEDPVRPLVLLEKEGSKWCAVLLEWWWRGDDPRAGEVFLVSPLCRTRGDAIQWTEGALLAVAKVEAERGLNADNFRSRVNFELLEAGFSVRGGL